MNAPERLRGAVPLEQAVAWRETLHARGRRVAFTNGCFDVLHAGHVHLLDRARAEADALIVGLNSDSSVRRLKGEGRPVQPCAERALVLSALEAVDRVVVFDDPTPLELILALRPDVLVKGADWAEDEIVGAREVRGWGGRVVRVPLLEGRSTTALIERISRGDDGPGGDQAGSR
ncbi:MAG: hypothetical protein Kow0062_17210 [Acidobacteriota bacterium]